MKYNPFRLYMARIKHDFKLRCTMTVVLFLVLLVVEYVSVSAADLPVTWSLPITAATVTLAATTLVGMLRLTMCSIFCLGCYYADDPELITQYHTLIKQGHL